MYMPYNNSSNRRLSQPLFNINCYDLYGCTSLIYFVGDSGRPEKGEHPLLYHNERCTMEVIL